LYNYACAVCQDSAVVNSGLYAVGGIGGSLFFGFILWYLSPARKIEEEFEEMEIGFGTLTVGNGKYSPKIKSVLAFLQILTTFSNVYAIDWPPRFRKFLECFGWITANFLNIPGLSLTCVANVGYFHTFTFMTVTPLLLTALLVVVHFVGMWLLKRKEGQLVQRGAEDTQDETTTAGIVTPIDGNGNGVPPRRRSSFRMEELTCDQHFAAFISLGLTKNKCFPTCHLCMNVGFSTASSDKKGVQSN
jgi:uncharacterized membrane protein